MISDLVQVQIEDGDRLRRLTVDESVGFSLLLYSAGSETVAKLLGNAAVILAGHAQQQVELASDATLLPRAVEELLRFEAPSPVQGRWTTRDISLHGVDIPHDSKVLLLTGSANRDPRNFDQPDVFDVHRKTPHVSFGYGVHFCLGASLARTRGSNRARGDAHPIPALDRGTRRPEAHAHQHRPRLPIRTDHHRIRS